MRGASWLILLTSELLWTSNRAALTVSPSRSQFFEYESVALICEDGGTVRRNTTRDTRAECEEWGKPVNSSCTLTGLLPLDSGLYWCESMSGSSSSSSSSIQLSVSGGSVILQSPVLPVMEGDDVTLSCRAKSPAHNLPAAFYKDGSFIGHETTGNLTLNSVNRSDEGLYHCNISGQGESPSSRISVEERITSTPLSSSTPLPLSMVLSLSSVAFLVFFILLVVLLTRRLCRKPADSAAAEVTEAPDRSASSAAERDSAAVYSSTRRKTPEEADPDPGAVYSSVKRERGVTYATVSIRTRREPAAEPDQHVVYSLLKWRATQPDPADPSNC